MRIVADLDKITANARATVDQCARHGVSVAAVTKCVCGEPEIVRAILAGGVREIGESRIDNVRRIRDAGIDCDVLLLRLPALSQADDVVALTTSSLNSEPRALRALSAAAVRQGKTHEVLVIVEWGDRREGVMPRGCRRPLPSGARAPRPRAHRPGLQPQLPVRRPSHAAATCRTSPTSSSAWRASWACASGPSAAATRTTCSSWRAAARRGASTTCASARASCSEGTASATCRCRAPITTRSGSTPRSSR